MKKLITIPSTILLAILGTALFIVSLPVIIVVLPYSYYDRWNRDRKLKRYLVELGDKNFFCYNNQVDAKDFIEK